MYIYGRKVSFFFGSNLNTGDKCIIEYLPNTLRAIKGVKISNDEIPVETKIRFPFKDMFIFLGVIIVLLSALAIIIVISKRLRFKLFFLACAIFYSIYFYLYIKFGIKNGVWFINNKFLIPLLANLLVAVLLRISYLIEIRQDEDCLISMILFQFLAMVQIGMVIIIFI